MSHVAKPLRRFVSLCSSRRGSMLIMVIVILVLLALIGTAMISTSRVDRLSVQQHSFNTQIDLLVQSVENMATAAIQSRMYGTGGLYRSGSGYYDYETPGDSSLPGTDQYGQAIHAGDNPYLSSRHPFQDPSNTASAPVWPWMTKQLIGSSFESPWVQVPGSSPIWNRNNTNVGLIGDTISTTGVAITANGVTTTYPGIIDAATNKLRLAGDADGDGIADSGLFRLPIGQLNGVTYYAAVRIIDNNSAINGSIAWSKNADYTSYDGTGALASPLTGYLGCFPSSIGLAESINTSDTATFSAFNKWRLGSKGALSTDSPINDANATAGTFNYISIGDLINNQLAHRLGNPGYVFSASGNVLANALTVSDSVNLAYRFCLQNTAAPLSNIESTTSGLPFSFLNSYGATIYNPAISTKPYAATGALTWYQNNFDFLIGTGTTLSNKVGPLRSYVVARNGVQTLAPTQDLSFIPPLYRTPYSATVVPANYLIPVPSTVATAAPIPPATLTQVQQIPKVSVNTAPFNMLWRGFWNVMANTSSLITNTQCSIPNDQDLLSNGNAHMFTPSFRDPFSTTMTTIAPSPMSGTSLSQSACFGQLMLRAAIAANNTINLRNAGRTGTSGKPEYNVISRHVSIYGSDPTSTAKLYDAMLYGTSPQPYITEVLVDTDTMGVNNPKGYIAVELFNPYPFSIKLTNWQLAVASVTGTTSPAPVTLTGIPNVTGTGSAIVDPTTSAAPTIAPNGYLVLDNYSATDTVATNYPAKVRPPSVSTAPTAVCYVPMLYKVLKDPSDSTVPGGELELLRPRRMVLTGAVNGGVLENDQTAALSSFTDTVDSLNSYNEGTVAAPTLTELVPADQFDFTNASLTLDNTSFEGFHYVRANGPSNQAAPDPNAWKCVYPGVYNPKAATTTLRVAATVINGPFATGGEPPYTTPAVKLGAADLTSTFTPDDVPPIQLANSGVAGPNPGMANGNMFPFGGFARRGDMLEIPYIGSYRMMNGANVIGLNSVTTDSSYARAGTAADRTLTVNNNYEHLGQFFRMVDTQTSATVTAAYVPTTTNRDYYDWCGRLFDFFDVSVPDDDYFPNVDPNRLSAYPDQTQTLKSATSASGPYVPYAYPSGDGSTIPYSVKNTTAAVAQDGRSVAGISATEDMAPQEGLININTAPFAVLATVPWVPNPNAPAIVDRFKVDASTGAVSAGNDLMDDNAEIAALIVGWRDGLNLGFTRASAVAHGPFKSLHDLNKVAATNSTAAAPLNFANAFGSLPASPGVAWGDLSPGDGATVDGVNGDAEKQFLMVNRVSNLLTTRSDTFTVYVLVQGWQNVGTTTPQLVVQRRAAIIVDRTALSPTNTSMTTTNVPTD